MSPNNNLNVLPWYTSLSQQNGNKWYAFGNVWPLVMPAGRLIPFQLVVPYTGVTVSGFSIINIETNGIYNGPTSSVSIVSRDSYTVIKMSGGSVSPTRLGRYYAKLTLSNGQIYYSEVFTFVDNISNYIKLQYWNDDNLYYNGGEINYENNFKFEMYLYTTIGKPEYQFEEEVTKRLGYRFPELQISNKVYKFTCVAPEFICDALRLVRLSDYIHITSGDDTYNALSFAYEAKWETQGDLASVEAEFETDNIIQKLESFNRRVRDSFYNALLTDTDVPFKFDESSIAQYYKDYMLTAENSNFINGKLIRELVSGEAITDTTYIAVDYGTGAAKKLNLKTVLSSIDTGFNVDKMWEELGKDNASKLIHPSHLGLLHKLFTPLDKDGNEVAYNDSTTEIKSIRVNYDFWGIGAVSAKGLSTGGGGGTGGIVQTAYGFTDLGGTFSDSDLNNTFNAYTINEIWKLANKGGLSDFSISGAGNAITNVEKAADGKSIIFKKDTTFATKAEFDTLNNKFNDFLTGSDTDDIINKWSELEVFLQGMKESDNLATILNGKMDKNALNRLFTALDAAGNKVDINDTTKTIATIRANYGLWSVDFVSAKGVSTGGGGAGGASALYQLADVLANADNTGVSGAAAGKALVFDGTHWKAGDAGLNESQLATYLTTNGYLKQVTADGKYLAKTEAASLYVAKTQKIIAGTGLSGGGALSGDVTLSLGTSGVTAGTYTKVTVDAYGRVTAGANLAATDIPSLDWSKITTGKPTTLAGYGITDAYTKAEADGKYVTLATTQTITGVKTFAHSGVDTITLKRTVSNGGAYVKYHANNNSAEYWRVGMLNTKDFLFEWGETYLVQINTTGTVSAPIFNASNALQVGDAYLKWDATNNAVYVVKKDGTTPVGFYATNFVSAKGVSSGGGSTSSNYLVDLLDTSISNPTNGQALVYNSSTQKWVNGTIDSFNTNQMWAELAKADASKKIDLSHFPTLFTALTSTSANNLSATIGGVTKSVNNVYARYLANLYTYRPASADVSFGDGTVRNFMATSTMTTGKPTEGDSHILHMAWDNTGGYDGQLSLPTNPAKSMSWRTQSSGTWGSWVKILDSSNYSGVLDGRYVKKSGDTMTGTLNINIPNNNSNLIINSTSSAYWSYLRLNNGANFWDIATKQSNTGLEFKLNGTDTVKWVMDTNGRLSSYGKGEIYLNQSSATSTQFIGFQGGDNDRGRLAFGATASNAGWMEIATADDGTEPIYVRQYTGKFGTVKNALTLMDSNGNTVISENKGLGIGYTSRQVRLSGAWIHGGTDSASSTDANLRFGSWYGIGWYPTVSGFPVTQGNNAMWLNTRNGYLDVAGRFKSNVATGTAPYQCVSTTLCDNLNADLLDGYHAHGTGADSIIKYGYSVGGTSPAWSRIAKYSIYNTEMTTDVCFILHSSFSDRFGILHIRTRGGGYIYGQLMLSYNIDASKIRIYHSEDKKAVELYYYGGESYSIINAQMLYNTNRDGTFSNDVTMYGSNTTAPSWSTYVGVSAVSLQNNVASATKLQTARTLWGQSFNGTANVSGNMTGVGNINTKESPAGTIYTSNWFRSTGATGWYSETYSGGWYMTDTNYIRNFNSKRLRIQTDMYDTVQLVRTSSTGGSSIAFYNNGGTYRGSFGCTANSWFSFDTGTATANQNVVEISTAGGIHSKAEITAKASGSDIRLKKDIQAFHAMGIIRRFRSVKYHWNDIAKANSEVYNNDYWQFGLIAQDLLAGGYEQWVRDVFHDYYTIAYERLIPVVWKGLQEVDSEVIRLRRRVEQLEKELYELKKTA